jgi:hypothetical protein
MVSMNMLMWLRYGTMSCLEDMDMLSLYILTLQPATSCVLFLTDSASSVSCIYYDRKLFSATQNALTDIGSLNRQAKGFPLSYLKFIATMIPTPARPTIHYSQLLNFQCKQYTTSPSAGKHLLVRILSFHRNIPCLQNWRFSAKN